MNTGPAAGAPPEAKVEGVEHVYEPLCSKCNRSIPVLMMCSIDGMPMPAGPNGSPIILVPAKCPRCGHKNFHFKVGGPTPAQLWTPAGGKIGR